MKAWFDIGLGQQNITQIRQAKAIWSLVPNRVIKVDVYRLPVQKRGLSCCLLMNLEKGLIVPNWSGR